MDWKLNSSILKICRTAFLPVMGPLFVNMIIPSRHFYELLLSFLLSYQFYHECFQNNLMKMKVLHRHLSVPSEFAKYIVKAQKFHYVWRNQLLNKKNYSLKLFRPLTYSHFKIFPFSALNRKIAVCTLYSALQCFLQWKYSVKQFEFTTFVHNNFTGAMHGYDSQMEGLFVTLYDALLLCNNVFALGASINNVIIFSSHFDPSFWRHLWIAL